MRLLPIVLLAGILPSPALADELWRQDHADCVANPSHCYGGLASQQARNPGGPGWMYESVDNFDAAAGWIVTNLEFWGGHAALVPAPTDGFMIRIYQDNNGQVGPLLSTQDVFSFTQEAFFTWIPAFPLQGFRYTLTLPQPFSVPAAGRYWMAIVAIQGYGRPGDTQWFWGLSNGQHAPTCQQTSTPPGTGFSSQPFDLAFVLFGDAGTAPCYANCDEGTNLPVLNVNDFICFQARFAAGQSYADCDNNSSLNVNDFICFQAAFAAGCR